MNLLNNKKKQLALYAINNHFFKMLVLFIKLNQVIFNLYRMTYPDTKQCRKIEFTKRNKIVRGIV